MKPPMGTRFYRWLENDVFDEPKWNRGRRGKVSDWLVDSFACWVNEHWPHRHYVIDDQCRHPGHRYCVWCMRNTPNAELSE